MIADYDFLKKKKKSGLKSELVIIKKEFDIDPVYHEKRLRTKINSYKDK